MYLIKATPVAGKVQYIKPFISRLLKKLPYLSAVFLERDRLRSELAALWVPPGHFYSPIPSKAEIREREHLIFPGYPDAIPGIDLNSEGQLKMFEEFKQYYSEQPWFDQKKEPLRYYFHNPSYSYSDAICLYCMIRHLRPRRIIEIGSGYSSTVMLDTNELFFSNSIACTFIDPHPELLFSLLKDSDYGHAEIISQKVQDVASSKFAELGARDILFVDSTHVSKIGSDINHIFFTLLPLLKSEVFIHFHDIFYPFEYPKEWVYEGCAWNEAYVLRAFLQYNSSFRIVFLNTFLEHFYRERFAEHMPLCLKNPGGSIWLERLAP